MSDFITKIIGSVPLILMGIVMIVCNGKIFSNLKILYKDTNIVDLAKKVQENNDELTEDIKNLCDMCLRVLKENAELKEEIKKIREKIYSVKE